MEEEIEYIQVEHDARQDVVVVAEPLRDLPRVEDDESTCVDIKILRRDHASSPTSTPSTAPDTLVDFHTGNR